jgi:hypothetical protein
MQASKTSPQNCPAKVALNAPLQIISQP